MTSFAPTHRIIRPIALTSVCALAMCTSAQAKIVLGQSIAAVKLGMTKAEVSKILGRGTKKPSGKRFSEATYRKGRYDVIFDHGHAGWIETMDPRQRTPQGLGVGTKVPKLQKRLPRVRCSYQISPHGQCVLGSQKPGHHYTEFDIESGNKPDRASLKVIDVIVANINPYL